MSQFHDQLQRYLTAAEANLKYLELQIAIDHPICLLASINTALKERTRILQDSAELVRDHIAVTKELLEYTITADQPLRFFQALNDPLPLS